MLPRVLGGLHHAACPSRPKAARHEDSSRAVEQPQAAFLFEGFGFDPLDTDAQAIGKPAVVERLVQRLVRVFVSRVLAHDMNRNLVVGVLDAFDQLLPRPHVSFGQR